MAKKRQQAKQENGPKYPHISVQLSGNDGNAFSILARVRRAMERGGVSPEDLDNFHNEATDGDYDHLIATCMKYVEVN